MKRKNVTGILILSVLGLTLVVLSAAAQSPSSNSAPEIGTSTGHSAIRTAWALSKTGGGVSISYKKSGK